MKKKLDEVNKDKTGFQNTTARRKLAEASQLEIEENFRELLENVQEGYFEIDLAGNFTFINDSVCRVLGCSRKEVMGINSGKFKDQDDVEEIFQAYNKVYKTGKPLKGVKWHVVVKDNSKRYLEGSISLRKDLSGKPIGFRVIVNDVTERKQAEEKLRESEASYRQLFDNSPAVIYRVDFKSGKFLKANDVFCEYLGCSQEEIYSRSPYDILTEASKKLFLERVEKISQGIKVPEIVEYEVLDKKRKQWCLRLHNKNIYDTEGNLVASDVVAHDITERKRMEEKLRETLESLRKSIKTTIQVLATASEARDPYTAGHQNRVADLARAIATEMGLSQDTIEGIRMAGSIHDVGKLSIPAEILSKFTKLTNIEFSLIKKHSRSGYEMLKDVESPWPLAQIVYQHHERMDGSGYPRNLKGDEIIIEARIMAVADVVEAMSSNRPYRPGFGIEVALEEIEKNKGIFYDDTVANTCLKLFREKGFKILEA